MKKYIIILFIIAMLSVLFSEQTPYTLNSIKKETGIPVKKLRQYLNLPKDYSIQKPMNNISAENIKDIKEKFKAEKSSLILSITLSGMGVVFISLLFVALLIAQFAHIKTIQKKIGPAKPCRNLTNDALVAAMLTVYLHELEVEEQNKLILTWKRANISMWKAVSKTETPNENYYKTRKK